ncbi:acyl-CoA desaturase [Moorena sp. SIOASIH]|uniref:acyl-CoA desaturase n=1 Tax=Moorena sp. SIOASIH TaxID=2607817 RepID=UPI0025EED779|nr:acyl-CoA desaturase [Moorena sp. SIOASIH]
MSIQSNSSTDVASTRHSGHKPRITIDNEHLQKRQWNFAFATIVVPFVGSSVALGLCWQWGIGAVEVGLLVVMYILTITGVTVGFHRYFSHKAFETKPPIRIILAILGSMAAQGSVINWVATHRRHHQYSDQPGDPHSPHFHEEKSLSKLHGLWHSHLGWMMNSKLTNYGLFAKDILREPILLKINQQYLTWVILGLAIPAALGGVLTWTWLGVFKGFLWGGLLRLFLVHHAYWYIGSSCHTIGSRPFDTRDKSGNQIWAAIPTFGEAWHNNHHAFPNSARFGLQWWQIDFGSWIIRCLELVGLAWNLKVPTPEIVEAKKTTY